MERLIEEIREDLERRITVAADRLTDRTQAEDPAYAALIGRPGLHERIHRTLGQAVSGLARVSRGLPVDRACADTARAEGTEAAERGLPLDSLLRGYRRAGRSLWQALTEAVTAHDRAALPRLLRRRRSCGRCWSGCRTPRQRRTGTPSPRAPTGTGSTGRPSSTRCWTTGGRPRRPRRPPPGSDSRSGAGSR